MLKNIKFHEGKNHVNSIWTHDHVAQIWKEKNPGGREHIHRQKTFSDQKNVENQTESKLKNNQVMLV